MNSSIIAFRTNNQVRLILTLLSLYADIQSMQVAFSVRGKEKVSLSNLWRYTFITHANVKEF